MPEARYNGRDSRQSSRRGEIANCKIIIHGRFYLKNDTNFDSSEAYSYVHMNKQERHTKQAVKERAVFKFHESYLRVCKPNVFSSVKESKYRYTDIEKYYVFADYPGIIVFCITMPAYRLAFLFECPSQDEANKVCNIVDDQKQRPIDPNRNSLGRYGSTTSDGTSDKSSDGRGTPVVMHTGPFGRGSSVDSYNDDEPRRRRPPEVLLGGPLNGRPSRPVSTGPGDRDYENIPTRTRPLSAGPDMLKFNDPIPNGRRPRSRGPPSKPLINVVYDRSPNSIPRTFKSGSTPSKSGHPNGNRHKCGQRLGSYDVSLLGRYRINDPRNDFTLDNAQSYLKVTLTNPNAANDKGELHVNPECMKLHALETGHYDYDNIHRIYCFDDDRNVLIFGLEDKHNRHMYMLLRFRKENQLTEAFQHITRHGNQGTTDFRLSDWSRGTSYAANGEGSIDRMSKTIALPSDREIQKKRHHRHSSSSSSDEEGRTRRQNVYAVTSSDRHYREVEEETIPGIRRQGVYAVNPVKSSDRNYREEFTTILKRNEREIQDNTKYIDTVIIDDVDTTRTTGSTMYIEEEDHRHSRRNPYHDEEVITASYNTNVHSSFKPVITKSEHLRRGSTQWIEEASYIDYKPGQGVVESDNGPVYMYCARQVRKNNYSLN